MKNKTKEMYESEVDKYLNEISILEENLKRKDNVIKRLEKKEHDWRYIARAEFKRLWDKIDEAEKRPDNSQKFSSLKEAEEFVYKRPSALDEFFAITLRASDLKVLFDKLKELKK